MGALGHPGGVGGLGDAVVRSGPEHLSPTDLVGCRYRTVQRRAFPDVPPTEAGRQRALRRDLAWQSVEALLHADVDSPASVGASRRGAPTRIDLDPGDECAEFHTLEALAEQPNVITGAVFAGRAAGRAWTVTVDILAKLSSGVYLPVVVSNHRVARKDPREAMLAISTARLGLGQPVDVRAVSRHHTLDGYRIALAYLGLSAAGAADEIRHLGGVIGQDREWAYLIDASRHVTATLSALRTPEPDGPRRVKECANCRYWTRCEQVLVDTDDISLFLPGERAASYRESGITTVSRLVEADLGEVSRTAAAWQAGVPVVRRQARVTAPRADVEVDVDVEAYLDQGAYLWGAFDGHQYHPFVMWDELGGSSEGKNFAEFWTWLMARRETARRHGQSFVAFCWASNGENHWMLSSARRFHGVVEGVPSEDEVRAFISSDQWIDMFRVAQRQLVGPRGLGLKQVAPQAGYHWSQEDFSGEDSVNEYIIASGDGPRAEEARQRLVSYNGDDCRATAAVRTWLRQGATSVPELSDF